MKLKFIFVFLLFSILLYGEDFSVDNELSLFETITNIDENYLELVNDDFVDIDKDKLFYYFVMVSEETDQLENFTKWFSDLEMSIENEAVKDFTTLNVIDYTDSMKKRFAEKLLLYLHSYAFKTYSMNSNKISDIINSGYYNCVSSSILYTIFLKKYGFSFSAIETSDHVFVEIEFKEDKIDVETTNKYGFNPGSKKEVLDDFGKVTGFNYVPSKDYKNRNKIDIKKLLLLLSHNLANSYFKNNDYIKAANLGFVIFKGRPDSKGREEFNTYFNNLLVDLSNRKKYLEGINLINKYFENYGISEIFTKIRFDLMGNYVNDWNDYANFTLFENYLIDENNRYEKLKNNKRFVEFYFYLIYKMVTYYNNNKNFDQSLELIKKFKSTYKHNETVKIFTNTLIDKIDSYYKSKERNIEEIKSVFNQLKTDFQEYITEIQKYERIYLINNANEALNSGDIENAMSEAKKLKNIYPKDKDILALIKNCYVKYTVDFYEKRDIENTINYSIEALTQYPNDITLTNNFKAFFQNFTYEAIENKDYTKARLILNKALNIFEKESYFLQLDKILKEKNY